jgi:L,D-peptidoglycan transpeptidase YkuD (ErfK/YbiS/YcfS/YnhG family)
MKKNIQVYKNDVLVFRNNTYRCALGKGGVKETKKEGDGATPCGCFKVRAVYYRKDKLGELIFPVPYYPISESDAWCNDSESECYNRHITVESAHPEKLWRDDNMYDVIAILGYNDNPPVPGNGSAIFMHVAHEGYTPTAGCIALSLEDIIEVLQHMRPETKVCVNDLQYE